MCSKLSHRSLALGAVLLALSLLSGAGTARGEDFAASIGFVKTASGEAFIERDGRKVAAKAGTSLLRGDLLATGPSSTMGIVLHDDTVMSLGPSTQTRLEHFQYQSGEGRVGMVIRVAQGMVSYLSGKIAKLYPGSVRLETPVATLGVRGTHLLIRVEP